LLLLLLASAGCVLTHPDDVVFVDDDDAVNPGNGDPGGDDDDDATDDDDPTNDDDDAVGIPPTVTGVYPGDGQLNVSIETTIQLHFDHAIDPETLRDGVRVHNDFGDVNGDWFWDSARFVALFDPSGLLNAGGTWYQLSVENVRGADGTPANAYECGFTTSVMDPSYLYRLSTDALGEATVLGTNQGSGGDPGGECRMEPLANEPHQLWYATPWDESPTYTHLRNVERGDAYFLDGRTGDEPCLVSATAEPAGVAWTFPSVGDGQIARRLQTEATGPELSLDVTSFAGIVVPVMAPTGPNAGQFWTFTHVGPRYGETLGDVPCNQEQPHADRFVVQGFGSLEVQVQTRSFDTRFDPRLVITSRMEPPFDMDVLADADDEVPCRFPPGPFGCPDATVQIQGAVSVLVIGLSECNPSGEGAYSLRITLDGKPIQPPQVDDNIDFQ
jgi:hypothetical protein